MTTPEMRILTVRQPWAWAIIHGQKDVENRVRNIAGDYRGPVAIHAGAVYDRSADEHPEIRRMAEARGVSSMREYLIPYGHHAYRHIAGVVDLVDVHMATPDSLGRIRCQPEDRAPGEWRPACSPWAQEANYHLELAHPRLLAKPIPYRGALGLRRLDDTTTARILAQIGAVMTEKTEDLVAEARRWANGHPNRRSGELMRDLADALSALTASGGDVRERLRKVVARGAFEDFADYPLDGENALVERVTDAILAAFPLPSRDIAGEIQAERLDTDHDAIGADAYINGLIRAEEIVRNGR